MKDFLTKSQNNNMFKPLVDTVNNVSSVENIVDNALETAQNDLYTEVNNRYKTQENQNQADNNDFYYDIFKLVSVIAGCRLFFSVIEWAN